MTRRPINGFIDDTTLVAKCMYQELRQYQSEGFLGWNNNKALMELSRQIEKLSQHWEELLLTKG